MNAAVEAIVKRVKEVFGAMRRFVIRGGELHEESRVTYLMQVADSGHPCLVGVRLVRRKCMGLEVGDALVYYLKNEADSTNRAPHHKLLKDYKELLGGAID